MDDIAAEAGITKPILYSNFGDKAGLADALATRFTRDLVKLFGEVWSQTDDPRERVAGSIDVWVGFIESDPHIYRFLSEGSFGAGRRLDDRRLVHDLGTVVARALGEWLREQGADSGPAEPWAFGVLGMVHVSTEWWLERRTLSRKDLVNYLTSLLWTGFSGNGLDTGRRRGWSGHRHGRDHARCRCLVRSRRQVGSTPSRRSATARCRSRRSSVTTAASSAVARPASTTRRPANHTSVTSPRPAAYSTADATS